VGHHLALDPGALASGREREGGQHRKGAERRGPKAAAA
jgi:hypothetical protein